MAAHSVGRTAVAPRLVLGVLTPVPRDRRPRRVVQLLVGLLLYGFTMGLMVRATLGLDPWDTFHQGLMKLVGPSRSPTAR